MWDTLAGSAVTGIIGIIGVFIGAKISATSSRRQEEKRMLAEFYAELFDAFTRYVTHNTSENAVPLGIAAQKVSLLCSEQSAALINELLLEVLDTKPSAKTYGEISDRLLEAAKEDIRN